MAVNATVADAHEALKDGRMLAKFIGRRQRRALQSLMRGEEADHFVDIVNSVTKAINEMPTVAKRSGSAFDDVVVLHYFVGSADWYITKKDSEPEQLQAFGWADLFGTGAPDAELGYINIEEVCEHAELDFYWTPKTLAQAIGRDAKGPLEASAAQGALL